MAFAKNSPSSHVEGMKQTNGIGRPGVAEEMLAVYFLECRNDLLTEWLDLLGLEPIHEADGRSLVPAILASLRGEASPLPEAVGAAFLDRRRELDPDERFYTPFFRELFEPETA